MPALPGGAGDNRQQRPIFTLVVDEAGPTIGTWGTRLGNISVDSEAIRRHSQRVGMPADEILDIADTVVIRPDPAPQVVAS
jgi:hypothetical protein